MGNILYTKTETFVRKLGKRYPDNTVDIHVYTKDKDMQQPVRVSMDNLSCECDEPLHRVYIDNPCIQLWSADGLPHSNVIEDMIDSGKLKFSNRCGLVINMYDFVDHIHEIKLGDSATLILIDPDHNDPERLRSDTHVDITVGSYSYVYSLGVRCNIRAGDCCVIEACESVINCGDNCVVTWSEDSKIEGFNKLTVNGCDRSVIAARDVYGNVNQATVNCELFAGGCEAGTNILCKEGAASVDSGVGVRAWDTFAVHDLRNHKSFGMEGSELTYYDDTPTVSQIKKSVTVTVDGVSYTVNAKDLDKVTNLLKSIEEK